MLCQAGKGVWGCNDKVPQLEKLFVTLSSGQRVSAHLCFCNFKLFDRPFVLGICLLLAVGLPLAEGRMDGLVQVLLAEEQWGLTAAIRVDR